jgi:hypothetical protein
MIMATKTRALLLVALLAGIALRCRELLNPRILSHDESFSWRITQYGFADMILHTTGAAHPPGYYCALKTWEMLWGTSPVALRSLSVVFGVLSIITIYALCCDTCRTMVKSSRYSGQAVYFGAFVSAFLLAIHACHIQADSTARMYSMGSGWQD